MSMNADIPTDETELTAACLHHLPMFERGECYPEVECCRITRATVAMISSARKGLSVQALHLRARRDLSRWKQGGAAVQLSCYSSIPLIFIDTSGQMNG